MRFDKLDVSDGVALRTAIAEPAEAPTASLVLLQGRTEFIEKYDEVIARLTAAGCRVFTLDWRGQGLSSRLLANPRKGYVGRYEDFLDDLDLFLERCVAPARTGPLIMLAHSMGGQIGLRHLYRTRGRFDGAVFSCPMWDLPLSRMQRSAARALASAACLLGAGGCYVPGQGDRGLAETPFEGNLLTADRRRYRRMRDQLAADPRLALGGPTLGWLHASLASIETLRREVRTDPLSLPVLVLSGRKDRVVDVATQQDYCARLSRAEYVAYPDGRHELLQEDDEIFEDALARILAFVARLAGGAATGR